MSKLQLSLCQNCTISGNFGDQVTCKCLIEFWCKVLKLCSVNKGIISVLLMNKVQKKINVSLCISRSLST